MIGGELVREARKRAALTQRELAERAGTTQSAIARLESGRTSPTLEQVQRLMRLAGFELIVELAPYDDSDRVQADPHSALEQRLARLLASTARMRELRGEVRLGA
jgi:transcriptional regulator with XRE-family HTH domain